MEKQSIVDHYRFVFGRLSGILGHFQIQQSFTCYIEATMLLQNPFNKSDTITKKKHSQDVETERDPIFSLP